MTGQSRAIAPQLASTSALDPLSMSAAADRRCPGCCTTRLMAPAFVCGSRCFAVSQPAAASVPLATDRACSRRLTAQRSRQLGALGMAGWYQKDRTASAVCLALWRSWPTPVRPAAPKQRQAAADVWLKIARYGGHMDVFTVASSGRKDDITQRRLPVTPTGPPAALLLPAADPPDVSSVHCGTGACCQAGE